MGRLRSTLIRWAKELEFRSPLRRHFFPRFNYNFSAPQLCFLCRCIEDSVDVPGSIAEVGCSNGATSVFLGQYLKAQRIEKCYYAVDTFCGFPFEDVRFEIEHRGKASRLYSGAFEVNKRKWFDTTMRDNGLDQIISIEADVNVFDLRTLGSLSLVILDVDLYRPMKKALGDLYDALSPGGIMVVDDCNSADLRFDGAHQAYREFMAEVGLPVRVVHEKLGLVEKPRHVDTKRALANGPSSNE
jgi:O-methyltransferase